MSPHIFAFGVVDTLRKRGIAAEQDGHDVRIACVVYSREGDETGNEMANRIESAHWRSIGPKLRWDRGSNGMGVPRWYAEPLCGDVVPRVQPEPMGGERWLVPVVGYDGSDRERVRGSPRRDLEEAQAVAEELAAATLRRRIEDARAALKSMGKGEKP